MFKLWTVWLPITNGWTSLIIVLPSLFLIDILAVALSNTIVASAVLISHVVPLSDTLASGCEYLSDSSDWAWIVAVWFCQPGISFLTSAYSSNSPDGSTL